MQEIWHQTWRIEFPLIWKITQIIPKYYGNTNQILFGLFPKNRHDISSMLDTAERQSMWGLQNCSLDYVGLSYSSVLLLTLSGCSWKQKVFYFIQLLDILDYCRPLIPMKNYSLVLVFVKLVVIKILLHNLILQLFVLDKIIHIKTCIYIIHPDF